MHRCNYCDRKFKWIEIVLESNKGQPNEIRCKNCGMLYKTTEETKKLEVSLLALPVFLIIAISVEVNWALSLMIFLLMFLMTLVRPFFAKYEFAEEDGKSKNKFGKVFGSIVAIAALGFIIWSIIPKHVSGTYDGPIEGEGVETNENFHVEIDGTITFNIFTFNQRFEGDLEIEGINLPISTKNSTAVIEFDSNKVGDFYYKYQEKGEEKEYEFGTAHADFGLGFGLKDLTLFHADTKTVYRAPANHSFDNRLFYWIPFKSTIEVIEFY
ncbi:hypothetical protein CEY16_12840 [Halalkalibacillus sediminis]|uniref:Uncharacterized protein n=1 Tax=Halalkalibacillus sediminis TaxID=2018042 RepID=A0A2I0QQV2_9BACI|nr:TIGR04104 family putative zinc finger protein [Halalkalibacillus sediminis]PKR76699.1 hypothetical protein CEY16_12840 [Halalkalibacillus sediminis]